MGTLLEFNLISSKMDAAMELYGENSTSIVKWARPSSSDQTKYKLETSQKYSKTIKFDILHYI